MYHTIPQMILKPTVIFVVWGKETEVVVQRGYPLRRNHTLAYSHRVSSHKEHSHRISTVEHLHLDIIRDGKIPSIDLVHDAF